MYRWVWTYIRKYKVGMAIGLTLSILCAAVNVVNPLVTGNIVDKVINVPEHDFNLLLKFILIMISATFGKAVIKYTYQVIFEHSSQNIIRNMREDMYAHIQSLPYSYHNNVDTGDLIQRCTTDNETIRNCLCSQLPELISIFAVLITAVLQMIRINQILMWVSLIIVPLAAITSIVFCIYVEKKFTEIEKEEAKL